MTAIETFFKITTNEINENLGETNIPYIEITNNEQTHKHNKNGEPLYWEVDTENFKFTLSDNKLQKNNTSRTVFVSFRRDNKNHKIELEMRDAKLFGPLAAIYKKEFIYASFSSAPLDPMHRQLFATIDKGFKDALINYKDQIFEGKPIDPSAYEYKPLLYKSEKEGNTLAWVSGITFPLVKREKMNQILQCYCKEGVGLAKELGTVCGAPFNYVSSEKNKKVINLKSKKLLEAKLTATVKNEVYNSTNTDKIIKEIKEFEEKDKDQNYKKAKEYANKSKRCDLYKRFLEDLKTITEEDKLKAKTDLQEAIDACSESDKKRYCAGTINNEVPPKAKITKYFIEVSFAVIAEKQKSYKPRVECTSAIWEEDEKIINSIDDEYN